MAEYQKFMFDNFVIECDEEECVAEPLVVPEDEDISVVSLDTIEEVVEESFDTEVNEEREETAEIVIEEPKAPTYTQEEMDMAVLTAEEKGFAKGKELALNDIEQQKQSTILQIEEQLKHLIISQEENTNLLENSALEIALAAVEKILPSLEHDVAKKEIEAFLMDNFSKFRRENNLAFCFNPNMAAEIAPILSKLANKHDYEGKISVHKDINLGLSDCKVEWKNGGVERNITKLKDKIKGLIQK